MKRRGKAASFAVLSWLAMLVGVPLVEGGISKAGAAQAIATFRVGIRIVPVRASRIVTHAALAAAGDKTGTPRNDTALPEKRFVIVKPGETLSTIAARFYGDATRYPEIFEANRDILVSPDVLPAGTRLYLP